MRAYALLELEGISGVYKLSLNEKCLIDEFENSIKSNNQYCTEYETLLGYIQLFSNNITIPSLKFKNITVRKSKHTEYEFRSKHIRIYAVTTSKSKKIVILAGFKTNQTRDLKKFRQISNNIE